MRSTYGKQLRAGYAVLVVSPKEYDLRYEWLFSDPGGDWKRTIDLTGWYGGIIRGGGRNWLKNIKMAAQG